MDQSRYWIQKERTPTCLNSHLLSSSNSFGESWEEQAFAEDAAGPLGGCIWPPRSYTCSFCRREFRSAQALGGHMNVHRRDRARLKQSPNNNQLVLEPKNPNNEIYNPNFDLDHHASSYSPKPSQLLRPFTCSFVQEQQKTILPWSKVESRKRFHITDMGNQLEKGYNYTKLNYTDNSSKKKSTHQIIEVSFRGNLACDMTPICNEKKEREEDGLIFKRRRTDDDSQKAASNLKNGDEAESSPNSTLENLDLELRLGDRL